MRLNLAAFGPGGRWLAFGMAAVVAVAYIFFNLHATWDPYARVGNIRAGLVNEDEAVQVDGATVAVGSELARSLLESKTFGWTQLTLTDAQARLDKGEIDFYLHVPKVASQVVTGLPTAPRAEPALLAVYVNPSFNYPMNQIADTLAATVREQLNGKIAASYLDKLLGGLDAAIKGVAKAADGARQVADGTQAARSGAGELSAGLEKATVGARELSSGIDQVAAGAGELADGGRQISTGNRRLAEGLDQAAAGAGALSDGGMQLRDGAVRLVDGYGQLARGAGQLGVGLDRAVAGVGQIKDGVNDSLTKEDPKLAEQSRIIEQAMKRLTIRKPYLLLDKDYRALMGALKALGARADELKQESVSALTGALSQLEDGLEQAADGAGQLAGGAWTGYEKGQEFVAGAGRLSAGAGELASGVRQATGGARQLSDGAGRLAAGAEQLAEGTRQLQAGGRALVAGMDQLQDGGHRLAGGLDQLGDGTRQLADGLGDAASSVAIPPRTNAPVMSQPVKVVGEKTTPVPKPGEALLALVLPLALWSGALILVAGARYLGAPWGAGATAWQRLRGMSVPGAGLAALAWAAGIGLGPRVASPLGMLLVILLATFSFIALIQMLAHTLGPWGYGIAGLLLALMPVAVGARAPYVMLPAFYKAAAVFLPVTHALRGIQATVAGGAPDILWISVALLAAYIGLALLIGHFVRSRLGDDGWGITLR